MIDSTIVRLTFRQLLGQKRTILMAAFALLPVLIALLVRLSAGSNDDLQELTAGVVLNGLVVGRCCHSRRCLRHGGAWQSSKMARAFVLALKPIPRSTVVLSKLLVRVGGDGWRMLVSALRRGDRNRGEPQDGIVLAFAVGVVVGSLVYCAAFIWLSIATDRR